MLYADQDQYERIEGYIQALCDLDYHHPMTPRQKRHVKNLLLKHRILSADFRLMDEKPGTFGYRDDGWHWKLRQTRNDRDANLFGALEANDKAPVY